MFFRADLGPPHNSSSILALDLLTALRCCLVATLGPKDITPDRSLLSSFPPKLIGGRGRGKGNEGTNRKQLGWLLSVPDRTGAMEELSKRAYNCTRRRQRQGVPASQLS